jgi:hypothetical protein
MREDGGPFFMRPIGQEIIAYIYSCFCDNDAAKLDFISKIPTELDSDFWHFVLWDPHARKMLTSKAYARNYLAYHFGLDLKSNQLSSLKKKYTENSGGSRVSLPPPLFK